MWQHSPVRFTLANFALGLLLGWLALYLVREQLATRRGRLPRRPDTVACLLFIKELILSGWRVARGPSTSPRMDLRPGISPTR